MKKFIILPIILGIAPSVFSQSDVVIPAGKPSPKVSPKVIDISTLNPQWSVATGKGKSMPENPQMQFITLQGPKNDLKPGGLLPTPIGSRLDTRFPGVQDGRFVPPDLDLAVGAVWTISTANSSLAIIKKDGTGKVQTQMETFFASVRQTNFLYDPKCYYDAFAKRFFVLCDELNESSSVSNLLIGVSQTEDPNGKWNLYKFNVAASINGTNSWLDYPGFGCNQDTMMLSGNMFAFNGGFTGSRILVVPKAPLLTGQPANFTPFDNLGAFTPQPARAGDATSNSMYALGLTNNSTFRAFAVTGGASASPTIVAQSVSIPATPPLQGDIIGPGNTPIDVFDGRPFGAYYRNGNALTAHTVGNGPNRTAVRWYEFNVAGWPGSGTPKLAQSGQIAGNPGESYHMPAIAKNSLGDITVLFNRTSNTIMADMMFSARTATTVAGQMGAPVLLASSNSTLGGSNGGRWGDYFTVCLDPDDFTFWGIAEVVRSNRWESEIQKWVVSVPNNQTGGLLPTSVSTFAGVLKSGTLTAVQYQDGVVYDVSSSPQTGLGQVAGIQTNFLGPVDTSKLTSATLEGVLVGTGNVTIQIYIADKNGQFSTPIRTVNLTAGTKFSVDMPGGVAAFMAADRSMKVLVRAVTPVQRNVMPSIFSLKLDLVRMLVR